MCFEMLCNEYYPNLVTGIEWIHCVVAFRVASDGLFLSRKSSVSVNRRSVDNNDGGGGGCLGLSTGNGQLVARLQSHYQGEALPLEYGDKRGRPLDRIHV